MTTETDGASSISVAVRVRPFTIREAAQLTRTDDAPLFLGEGSLAAAQPKLHQKGIRPIIKVVDDRCLVFDPPEENPIQRFSKSVVPQFKRVKDQTFAFDKVFDETTTQGDVYEATTKSLLDNVLDGYNATVFAYGATGCGKTHTITGTLQQPGIIFLTMQELFEKIAELQEEKVTEISLSYLEIYNETIRDLLEPGVGKGGLMLREDANQVVSVPGLSSHAPRNVQEVMDMVVRGNEYRTQSPTDANATSSRSHAVLQVNVSQRDRNASVDEPHTVATLSIIDLAGSERASATKNRGDRLLEGANINKSLLALGSCINALCDPRKKNHVPYRNSKLTRLLKFSLGGNCKTVMIVCVSPSSVHFDETQNTLRYANRAKNIQTKVSRNVFNVNRHVKDYLKKIDEQMAQINELQTKLKDYENVAFVKFRKQGDKRETVVREGTQRLRTAYDHTNADRQKRISGMKKLRQIERRITLLSAWISAFDEVCEIREEEEPPKNLTAMRTTAEGIRVELEGSRHHFHQLMSKSTWQRPIETALQTGLDQLHDLAEGAEIAAEVSTLEREAELLKSNAERELYIATLDHEKNHDASLMQVLLQAHFETIAIINQLLSMDEEEAVQAAKDVLHKMFTACSDATSQVVRPDGTIPVTEAAPPSRSGTPKRKKSAPLLGPSPNKARVFAPAQAAIQVDMTPVKASPRRRIMGSARRGISVTPRKKLPVKRAVRWRDDTENGELADYENTPKQQEATPPETSSSIELPPMPQMATLPENLQEDSDNVNSSPMPTQPRSSLDLTLKSSKGGRFQAGFLTRKPSGGSTNPSNPFANSSSSPEPAPLQETSPNRVTHSRFSSELMPPPQLAASQLNNDKETAENTSTGSGSESERDPENASRDWPHSDEDSRASQASADADQIKRAVRRASLSRRSSIANQNRVHRRRSPPMSGAGHAGMVHSSPMLSDGSGIAGLIGGAHARRMARLNERDSPAKFAIPGVSMNGSRRITMNDEKSFHRVRASAGSAPGSAVRVTSSSIGNNRGSLAGTGKSAWR